MKQEPLEEAALLYQKHFGVRPSQFADEDFIAGAKWYQKRSYSEEDMKFAYEQGARLALISQSPLALQKGMLPTPDEWFEKFKKIDCLQNKHE